MLLTSSARCGGSFFWKSPSNRRLPTCPGTGASSQLDRPEENSQANKCCLPPPRRYRAYNNRSIARVPTAPAASPRPAAPSGVPAVFRLMSLQDLIGTVQDWFTAVLLSQARELLVPALTSSFRVLLEWLVHDGAGVGCRHQLAGSGCPGGFGTPQDPHEGMVPIRACRVERSSPPEVRYRLSPLPISAPPGSVPVQAAATISPSATSASIV